MAEKNINQRNHQFTESNRSPAGLVWFLLGTAAGALSVYLLDPISGQRRRALVRDKGVRYSGDARVVTARALRDLNNRAKGLAAEAAKMRARREKVDDGTLEQRVRSEFGRKVSHAHAIKTEVHDGVVILRGPILASEVDDLLSCVRNVAGVKDVESQLDVHQRSEKIPGLQGEGKEYLQ